ncbi:MAG: magnesium transporter CorA family protein [Candidatus Absconditicoccaceae bacterium]
MPYKINRMLKNVLKIGKIKWIHLSKPTHHQLEEAIKNLDLHEMVEQDLIEPSAHDKIDVYDDCIFLVIHFPKYNEKLGKYLSNEMNIILGRDFIITITKYPTNNIEKIRQEYEQEIKEEGEEAEEYKISPYYILYKIIDVMYDKILLGLNKFNLDLMEMEKQVFDKSFVDTDLLKNVLIKKRNTVLLKTIISPQEEILVELQKVTANFYEGDLDVYFEDLEYKTSKILGHISIIHENIDSIGEIFNTLTNMMTNKNIGILTVLTVIIGIMTMISGIYGMNIGLPFQNYPGAFIVLMGFMVMMAVFTVLIFKKKKRL